MFAAITLSELTDSLKCEILDSSHYGREGTNLPMLTMRRVTKATELKRFKELEGECRYMGETHSGGDTMRLVFEEDGKWVALMLVRDEDC